MKKLVVSIFCAQLILSNGVFGAEKASEIKTKNRCEFITERDLSSFVDKFQRDPSVVTDLVALISAPNPSVSKLDTLMLTHLPQRLEDQTKVLDQNGLINRLMPNQGQMTMDLSCLVIRTILRVN